jgi:hypothetical protein
LLASAFVVFRSLPSLTFFMPLCTGVRGETARKVPKGLAL